MNQWYVISGGPGSGKTTVIKLLEQRGYATVPEMARHRIDERLASGELIEDITRDPAAFQHEVLSHQIAAEKTAPKDRVTFFDRGIPDALAYYRYQHMPEDDLINDAIAGSSYKKIFMLEPLPIVSDYARSETEKQQHELATLIREAYASLTFPIVNVPILPPDERVDYILARL